MTKFIFVIGGVMSGVGKGVSVSSLGALLEAHGYRVSAMKIDAYINVDAGTMNPTEHGEVFVTEDGDETDQDIGNYERFLGENIHTTNYVTTGRVYQKVIEDERNLKYGGRCVEVVPHIPEEVIRRIRLAAKKAKADIFLIEIGGTVGEYQNILFLEAARMMKVTEPGNVAFVLVSYLPTPPHIGEMKTKPTQYAARGLNAAGIQADFIVARSSEPLDEPRRRKLGIFCSLEPGAIISAPNVDSIYELPLLFAREKFGEKMLIKLGCRVRTPQMKTWQSLVRTVKGVKDEVRIAIIGKYFLTGKYTLSDAYISVIESLKHAAWYWKKKPVFEWLSAEDYEHDPRKLRELDRFDGVLIPGGFGSRGIEGKIRAIQYVREKKIPYFGLCYGMQLATIEFARNVAGLADAHTTEIDPKTPHPVIYANPYQMQNIINKRYGGTMRLGSYPCSLTKGTIAQKAYGASRVSERHRHRYEFNNAYWDRLEKKGLRFSGIYSAKKLVEIIELPSHPFFVGVQFHPEFQSRPFRPHPLFREFLKAAILRKKKK
ncbi:MAG: CTP synthase [bacterium]|nr:CTP synthase [bacterium]